MAKSAGLTNGNWIVTWQGETSNSSFDQIYATILSNTSGDVVNNGAFRVSLDTASITFTGYHQTLPTVTALSNGNCIIHWQGFSNIATTLRQVFGVIISNTSGVSVHNGCFKINIDIPPLIFTGYDSLRPSSFTLPNGNLVVVWNGRSTLNMGDYQIHATILTNLSGTIVNNGPFRVSIDKPTITFTGHWQMNPVGTVLPNGNCVIVWRGKSSISTVKYQIYATLMSNTSGLNFVNNLPFLVSFDTAVTFTGYDQNLPAAIALPNGNLVIAWDGWSNSDTLMQIFASILTNTTGTILSTSGPFRVTNSTPSFNCQGYYQKWPTMVVLNNGNWLINWEGLTTTSSAYEIFEIIFTSSCYSDSDCSSAAPFCNMTTHMCAYCRTPGHSSDCLSFIDPTGLRPICSSMFTCVGCNTLLPNNPCPQSAPYCFADGSCLACTSNEECQGINATHPICNLLNGECMECSSNTECQTAFNPLHLNETICYLDGSCGPCLSNSECASPTPYCHPTNEYCVECNANLECTSLSAPRCNLTSNTCAPCTNSTTDCLPNFPSAPICDISGSCVQCITDTYCPDSYFCDSTTKQCKQTPITTSSIPTNLLQSIFNTTEFLEENPQVEEGVTAGLTVNNFDNIMLIILSFLFLVALFLLGPPVAKKLVLDKRHDVYWMSGGEHFFNLRNLFLQLICILELVFFGIIPMGQCFFNGSCYEIFESNYQVCLISPALFVFGRISLDCIFKSSKKNMDFAKNRKESGKKKSDKSEPIEKIVMKQIFFGAIWVLPVSILSSSVLGFDENFTSGVISNMSFLASSIFLNNTVLVGALNLCLWIIKSLLSKKVPFYVKRLIINEPKLRSQKAKGELITMAFLTSAQLLKKIYNIFPDYLNSISKPVNVECCSNGYKFLTTEPGYGQLSGIKNGKKVAIDEDDFEKDPPKVTVSEISNEQKSVNDLNDSNSEFETTTQSSPLRLPRLKTKSMNKYQDNSLEYVVKIPNPNADVGRLTQLNEEEIDDVIAIPCNEGISQSGDRLISKYLLCNVRAENENPKVVAIKNLDNFIKKMDTNANLNDKPKHSLVIELPRQINSKRKLASTLTFVRFQSENSTKIITN